MYYTTILSKLNNSKVITFHYSLYPNHMLFLSITFSWFDNFDVSLRLKALRHSSEGTCVLPMTEPT